MKNEINGFVAGEKLLSTDEAAQVIRLSPYWLHKARIEGRGPRYVRLGRKVFYRRADLEAYVANCTVETSHTRRYPE